MSEPSLLALPILGQPTAPANGSPFRQRLDALREHLINIDDRQAVVHFDLDGQDRLLKSTISLCPECLEPVAALVYSLSGKIWIRKRCARHGLSTALLENDERFYFLSNKDYWGRLYAPDRILKFPAFEGGCCGDSGCCSRLSERNEVLDFTDQRGNKSCTVLVEITNACNLSCKVCYSDARGDRVLPLERFRAFLLRLIEEKGGLDSVQLTGGEAVLHPQFAEIAAFVHAQEGVRKIYLPTNGLLFADRANAERLLPLRDKLMVLLQFDAKRSEANRELRNANPTKIRERVIDQMGELGIVMQLTMTLTKGVNDDEIGWVIDTALRHAHIKVAALQPVTYSGRYELDRDPVERLTLSDVVKGVVRQAQTRMHERDFVPIPCSHPNCGWLTLFVRRFGLRVNVARHIDIAAAMQQTAYKTILSQQEIRELVGASRPSLASRLIGGLGRRLVRPTDLFGIAIKPFMDCFTYDQDRISNCCHHLMDTHGRPVSFCEYNARLRVTDSWEAFPIRAVY